MPVVGRGDADDVDALVIENLANVLLKPDGLSLCLLGLGEARSDDGLVAVADDRDDAVMLAGKAVDMLTAAALDADDGDAQLLVAAAGGLLRRVRHAAHGAQSRQGRREGRRVL